jgi:hypothetical protein
VTSPGDLVTAARRRLEEADAPLEALGEHAPQGRVIRRAPRIRPVGSAWRLGVLLMTPDGDLLEVGDVVRAATEARRGYAAESARARAVERGAAVRGGFREGETVHVGWRRIDLDAVDRGEASGPLEVVDGVVMVRWAPAGGLVPLEVYLPDRIALLLDPPGGA